MKSPFFQLKLKGIPKKQRVKLWYVFKQLKGPRFFSYTRNTKGEILLVAQNPGFVFRRLTIGKRGGLKHEGRYIKCAQWLKK